MALAVKSSNVLSNHFCRLAFRSGINSQKRWISRAFPLCQVAGSNASNNIIKSNNPDGVVTGVTLPEFLWSNLEKWPSAPAFECGVSKRMYTHEQVYKLSRNFGAALMQHGLKHGDVVGILLPNIPEYAIAILGIWEAHLTVTTVNPTYTPGEIAKQMNDCKAKVLVTLSDCVPLAEEVMKLSPSLKSIIAIGEARDGCHSFSEMVKVNSTGVDFAKGSKLDTTEEIAFLPYSSGTTGPPKGVMLSHSNICSNIYQLTRPGYIETHFFDNGNPQERYIGILPFFHIYGFTVIMAKSLYQGAFTRTLPKFEPQTFIQSIREHKPTCIHLVPPLIAFMANSPEFTKKEFESVKVIMGGAAPIGETLIKRILAKARDDFFFQEGYGMSELSPVCHLLPAWTKNKKLGSCGVVLPATECKVIDPSTGEPLGPQERGELCIRGPQVMKGYLGNEKATAETLDKDGWLHTGDVAIYDEDFCFYIVDRMKELIKVKGLQVAPSELEDLLRTHPDVADVAVIGIPDERAGELPRAYIVRKKESLSESDVQEFVAKVVSEHKKLKGGVEFLPAIPKAASGKILRRELKAMYLSKS